MDKLVEVLSTLNRLAEAFNGQRHNRDQVVQRRRATLGPAPDRRQRVAASLAQPHEAVLQYLDGRATLLDEVGDALHEAGTGPAEPVYEGLHELDRVGEDLVDVP